MYALMILFGVWVWEEELGDFEIFLGGGLRLGACFRRRIWDELN